jgi:hypothetical protein
MPNILTNQVITRRDDDVAFTHVAKLMKNFGETHRDGGFAGAGTTGEAHVQRGPNRSKLCLLTKLGDQQQCRNFADTRFDRHQTNQFAVELIEQTRNGGIAINRININNIKLGNDVRHVRFSMV